MCRCVRETSLPSVLPTNSRPSSLPAQCWVPAPTQDFVVDCTVLRSDPDSSIQQFLFSTLSLSPSTFLSTMLKNLSLFKKRLASPSSPSCPVSLSLQSHASSKGGECSRYGVYLNSFPPHHTAGSASTPHRPTNAALAVTK